MTTRRYQYDREITWHRFRVLSQVDPDGTRIAVLTLPAGLAPEIYYDVLDTVSRAYEQGRDDRAEEYAQEDAPG